MRAPLPATILVTLLFASTAIAQAPFGHLVTAETFSGKGDGLVFVNPRTGIADRVRWLDGQTWNGASLCVTLDVNELRYLYTSAGASIMGPPVLQYDMQANRIVGTGPYSAASPFFGLLGRMHAFSPGKLLLYTLNTGGNPGLVTRTLTGTQKDTIYATITDAYNVTSLGNLVYVSTWDRLGQNPSRMFMVDILNSGKPVEIKILSSSTRFSFRALAADPGQGRLLLGDDSGVVWGLDPTTGKLTKLAASTTKGPIIAIACANPKTDPMAVAWVANSSAVWSLAGWSSAVKPVYSTTETIQDIAVSPHDHAAVLYFGDGCKGSNGKVPHCVFGGYPIYGVKTIRIPMVDGPPNTNILLFFGASRTAWGSNPLPMSLAFMGAPGCNLLISLDVGLPGQTDSSGAFTWYTSVPPIPALIGTSAIAQFGIHDKGANAADTTVTDAAEFLIR
jgi:hypothetical protein